MNNTDSDSDLHYLIIIDDLKSNGYSGKRNFFFNYLLNNYNTQQSLFFWKSIRHFIELKHNMINNENLRIKLLNGNIYSLACCQEMMFAVNSEHKTLVS